MTAQHAYTSPIQALADPALREDLWLPGFTSADIINAILTENDPERVQRVYKAWEEGLLHIVEGSPFPDVKPIPYEHLDSEERAYFAEGLAEATIATAILDPTWHAEYYTGPWGSAENHIAAHTAYVEWYQGKRLEEDTEAASSVTEAPAAPEPVAPDLPANVSPLNAAPEAEAEPVSEPVSEPEAEVESPGPAIVAESYSEAVAQYEASCKEQWAAIEAHRRERAAIDSRMKEENKAMVVEYKAFKESAKPNKGDYDG